MVNHLQLLDVLFGEHPVAFLVLLQFDDGEFLVPEADQGSADSQHFSHLADAEEYLFYFGFFVGHG
jgi:hypothetical protein